MLRGQNPFIPLTILAQLRDSEQDVLMAAKLLEFFGQAGNGPFFKVDEYLEMATTFGNEKVTPITPVYELVSVSSKDLLTERERRNFQYTNVLDKAQMEFGLYPCTTLDGLLAFKQLIANCKTDPVHNAVRGAFVCTFQPGKENADNSPERLLYIAPSSMDHGFITFHSVYDTTGKLSDNFIGEFLVPNNQETQLIFRRYNE